MIIVEGTLKIDAAAVERAKPQIAELIAATRAEDGNVDYAFAEDLAEPGLLRFVERWRDRAALDAHMKSPHMKTFGRALAGFGLAGAPVIRIWKAEQEK